MRDMCSEHNLPTRYLAFLSLDERQRKWLQHDCSTRDKHPELANLNDRSDGHCFSPLVPLTGRLYSQGDLTVKEALK